MDCVYMGNLIKENRVNNKMTQKELGEMVHVSDKAVSKWERGICFPDINLLEPLAEALNIPVDTLISPEEKRQLRKEKRNKNIGIVCVVYFLIGIIGVVLHLFIPIIYVRRMAVFVISIVYLLMFCGTIIFIWERDKKNENN